MRPIRLLTALASAAALAGCSDATTETPIGGPAFDASFAVVDSLRVPTITGTPWTRTTPDGPVVDSITGYVSFTKPLDGRARYRFYAVNAVDSTAIPVAHVQVIERADSTLDAAGNIKVDVRTQNNGLRDYWSGANYSARLRYRVVFSPTDTIQQTTGWLVLTIQRDSTQSAWDAQTPKPLFLRFRDQRGTRARGDDSVLVGDTLRGAFGTFRSPARQETFVARGGGRATIWDLRETAGARPFVSLSVTGLPRPPRGFFWLPYLRDARTGLSVASGPLVGLDGRTLFDADTASADSVIAAARALVEPPSPTERPIREYTEVALVLEPKVNSFTVGQAVAVPGATTALRAPIPAAVTSQRPGDGSVRVLVRRTVQAGTPEPEVGVVVLGPGSDFNTFLASRNTDASGTATFANIPAGRVRVVIFPPPGRTAVQPSQQTVTVPSGSDVTVTFVVN